ncbi:MAG: tetratricopeptide repeat protein [Acidobacteriota bacterium]|nr:tetratricopeptide repeat protein [Acidobacteriota bacterium]
MKSHSRNLLISIGAAALMAPAVWADKEDPVGLILSPGGSKVLRADTLTPLGARVGDLLFAGDGIRTADAPASYLFCPAKASETLGPASEARFDAKQTKVKTGKLLGQKPVLSCALPQAIRVANASQQHYGVSMTRGVASDFPPVPRAQLPAEVIAELKTSDDALAADPNDPAGHVGAAAVYEKYKLPANALSEYQKLRALWPEAEWLKVKMFELENALAEASAASSAASAAAGRTYALLVGISKYKHPEISLQFANADADLMGKLLRTGRGGGLGADDILLLTDEKATTAAVRSGFQDFLKRRAGKNDTIVILLAGHGTVDANNAYILTYDSDPQDLKSTALAMADLQQLFQEQLARVGRVVIFVDVCKAATIGTIHSQSVNEQVQTLDKAPGDMFLLMASQPGQLSVEGPEYGGGHGVFSYYIVKGLLGAADEDKNGVVDADELKTYVTAEVRKATSRKQIPREGGKYPPELKLSDTTKAGMEMAHYRMMFDSRNGGPLYLASASPDPEPLSPQAEADVSQFEAALAAHRLRPDQPNSAFAALTKLKNQLSPDQYALKENQLRVALEDEAQKVLLRYLEGDKNPQTEQDFASGARYMTAARELTRESLFLEGRQDFYQGRALLFEKKFPEAAGLLESSVRIDPAAAYAYNALGIAYLEQADFAKAIPAFRDAARRAKHWSYPLHNLALAYVETGDNKSAIRAYQDAMRLTPNYAYLPYNLGLVYQRINRRKEAEASYRQAIELEPELAPPYNALGTLKASEGKRAEAERLYRQALEKKPGFVEARYNLGLLLASEKSRQTEAISLWRENENQAPDSLPSRLSLAEALAASGDAKGAAEEYRAVLKLKPGYIAARVALGRLLAASGDPEGALVELREAVRLDAGNSATFEQIGDIEAGRGHAAEAAAAYQSALEQAPDRAAKKRIEKKMGAKPAR